MKMKLTIKGLLVVVGLFLMGFTANAQSCPDFNYTVTSGNHVILFQGACQITIDGTPAPIGSYIGAFFTNTSGNLQCAGYGQWNAAASQSVTAWGVDVVDDGFAAGEAFNWKLCTPSGVEYSDGIATYNTNFPFSGGNFGTNEMSEVTVLTFASAKNLVATDWVTPQTYCGLSSTEVVSVEVSNDTTGAISDAYDLSYSIDSGATWVTETFTTPVPGFSSVVCTFSQTADFSAFANVAGADADSTYYIMFKIDYATDLDTTDNFFADSVINMVPPDVSVSGLDPSYCYYGNFAVQLSGYPSGGTFSGPGAIADQFTVSLAGPPFAGPGQSCVVYTYFDSITGCNGKDTICTEVFMPTVVDIDPQPSYDLCQYDEITLVPDNPGGVFHGPANILDTVTGVFAPQVPGTYYVYYSYVDANGCVDDSPVDTFTVHALPNANFVNLKRAYCKNGSAVTLEGDPANGAFSVDGTQITPLFDPSLYPAGIRSLGYLYTDLNGCTDEAFVNVRIFNEPSVSYTGLDPEYCKNDDAVTLVGTPAGGEWSGAITTDLWDPNTDGTFNITYTYTQANLYVDTAFCTESETQMTTVHDLPVVQLGDDIETCDPDTIILACDPWLSAFEWNTGETTDDITTTGYGGYAVTVTDNHGCNGKDSIFIGGTNVELIVNIAPASNCTITDGSTVTLQYTNVGTYVFQPSDNILFTAYLAGHDALEAFDDRTDPFAPGDTLEFTFPLPLDGGQTLESIGSYDLLAYLSYIPSGTNFEDCMSSNDTIYPEIIHAGLPVVDLGFDSIPSNFPDSIVLDAGIHDSVMWSTGETTQTITNLMNDYHLYSVSVYDIYECEATDEVVIYDIDELPSSYERMSLYPNPNDGKFTLDVENKTYTELSYQIVDMSGRVILSKEMGTARIMSESIDLRGQSKGIYFLNVNNGTDNAVIKIVIQ